MVTDTFLWSRQESRTTPGDQVRPCSHNNCFNRLNCVWLAYVTSEIATHSLHNFCKQESRPAGNRKRHTAGGITCPSVTCRGGGGVPHPDLAGDWATPLGRDLKPVTGVPAAKDMGPVEVLWDGDGVPPPKGHGTSASIMGWRWVPPRVWTNKQTENITSRCISYAGGNNSKTILFSYENHWSLYRTGMLWFHSQNNCLPNPPLHHVTNWVAHLFSWALNGAYGAFTLSDTQTDRNETVTSICTASSPMLTPPIPILLCACIRGGGAWWT